MSLTAVFQIGSLGDSIVSVPVIRSLRDLIPGCSEYLLVSRFDTHAKVMPNQVFDMVWKAKHEVAYQGPKKGLKEALSMGALFAKLRYYRPQSCVYLMPTRRTPAQVERDRLFFRAAGVRNLIGFRTLTPEENTPSSTPDVRRTEAFLRFQRAWGDRADTLFSQYATTPMLNPGGQAQARVTQWLASNRRFPERPLVVVCPYSNSSAKNIPDQIAAELIERLETSAGAEVVVAGGGKDRGPASAILQKAGRGLNACGEFSTHESAALLEQSVLVLTADSGPMHLAGALGIPSVVVFSRISKELWRWFPFGKNHTILYRDVPCAGCELTECAVPGHPCIRSISLEGILSEAVQKLKGFAPTSPMALDGTTVLSW